MHNENLLLLQHFSDDYQEQSGVSPADAGQENKESVKESKKTWAEILEDPEYRSEYDRQVQSIVKKRLRDRQGNQERLKKLDAAMDEIGRSFGLSRQQGREQDPAQLVERVRAERQEQLKSEFARAAQAKARLDSLSREAEKLRETRPDFNLSREMENPEFLKLTAPHTGLSLEDAYYALHRREINRSLARAGEISAVKAISSGAARPRELRGGQGASTQPEDPRNMSRDQRQALKKRIYQASAQGKKLPYGS